MESSSLNSKEKEPQQMQQEERQLHSKCMEWEPQMKEREVKAIKEIKKWLNESKMQTQEGMVNEDSEITWVNEIVSEVENDTVRPSYDKDTLTEVHHSNNDTCENVFAHGIQNHEQPESIPDTYVVKKENNSNIISDIPNMDPDRDREDHDYVDAEQQRALFASLFNNLKYEVENCNKDYREAQQADTLLTKELKKYKEKEKHFPKEKK
ncbi:hypothetical protein Tco_1028773 [Tanacetum coccineum]|uniref:Uncharacterized protein n=1 Tax=Tanacetum coccineum TaxID=301880 RepID=A0ABQ5G3Q4_9ASTR